MGFCFSLAKIASCFCFQSAGRKEEIDSFRNSIPSTPPGSAVSGNIDSNTNSIRSSSLASGINVHKEDPVVEWTSGARKETVTIHWKVQNFPALCELKELLRNETCVFSVGNSIHTSTRWCFNLQKMKNENNIGLFLKRLKPLTFNEVLDMSSATHDSQLDTNGNKTNDNNNVNVAVVVAPLANQGISPPPVSGQEATSREDDEAVYIYYECIIKRSGIGEIWLHKRTCIPNFEVGQRLGFRKLFTLDDMNEAEQQQQGILKAKQIPLLSTDCTLNLEIKFTIHLKTDGRTKSETNLLETISLENNERYHCQLLRKQLGSLLNSGINSDLILIMEADDKTFPVHKGILSARSPVFAAMIQSGMKESRSGIVRIKDVSSKAMENMLSYVYSGTPNVALDWTNVREVEELIYAADKYSLDGLRDLCDKTMYTGCLNDNATELLYLAQVHGLNVAVKEISLYIKRNVNEIFDTQPS